jgi:hypothetical protein
MGAIAAKLIKAVAEGRFGKPIARVYWFLAGKKTVLGIVAGTAYTGLRLAHEINGCLSCGDWAHMLAVASVTLVSVGLLDAAVREDPPQKPLSIR